MASELTLGFLGAGKMATARARGFIAAKLTSARSLVASDVVEAARRERDGFMGAEITHGGRRVNMDLLAANGCEAANSKRRSGETGTAAPYPLQFIALTTAEQQGREVWEKPGDGRRQGRVRPTGSEANDFACPRGA